ncbi:hypothetical protein SRHO_G00096300 [Serrasalmus rhombeus]
MRSDGVAHSKIVVGGNELEEVESYLGQEVNMRHDLTKEISQRIRSGWKAFNSVKDVLKAKKKEEKRLLTTQRAMERSMLGISLRDHIRNEEIRCRNGVKDVIAELRAVAE